MTYLDQRERSVTVLNPEALRHANLPELASKLVGTVPMAERVRILDPNGETLADTGGVPCPT
ncbi:hypothetical protein [Frankia sp. R43]|uniref:hypothetical protein n=1 Tax=Frankia sp. R43 TaxID=269536 RepID=UPI001F251B64|nr:hypothetical protein [Frankia sp. R43]